MIPLSSSKYFVFASAQPPKLSSSVSSVSGSGNGSLGSRHPRRRSPPSMSGRKPALAYRVWPSSLSWKSRKSFAAGDASVGDGARVLDQQRAVGDDVVEVVATLLGEDGVVLVGEQDVAVAGRKEVVASRPLPGMATVLASSLVEVRRRRRPRCRRRPDRAQAARMFHFAEPEDAGFGVTSSTPGLTRSSQRLDAHGVARADDQDHDGRGADALGVVVVPVVGHQARVDELLHVGLEGEVDLVGVLAGDDRAGLVTGGAVGGP